MEMLTSSLDCLGVKRQMESYRTSRNQKTSLMVSDPSFVQQYGLAFACQPSWACTFLEAAQTPAQANTPLQFFITDTIKKAVHAHLFLTALKHSAMDLCLSGT